MPRGKFDSTNQKHYPDLGSDTSSVWNFCARFVDVIWQGKPVVTSPNVGSFVSLVSVTVIPECLFGYEKRIIPI